MLCELMCDVRVWVSQWATSVFYMKLTSNATGNGEIYIKIYMNRKENYFKEKRGANLNI